MPPERESTSLSPFATASGIFKSVISPVSVNYRWYRSAPIHSRNNQYLEKYILLLNFMNIKQDVLKAII
ncbi:MAG: hypothetical protein PHO69_10580 [Petrimonas sp.]|nr:hypothetical protein [Petrimonas sp.]